MRFFAVIFLIVIIFLIFIIVYANSERCASKAAPALALGATFCAIFLGRPWRLIQQLSSTHLPFPPTRSRPNANWLQRAKRAGALGAAQRGRALLYFADLANRRLPQNKRLAARAGMGLKRPGMRPEETCSVVDGLGPDSLGADGHPILGARHFAVQSREPGCMIQERGEDSACRPGPARPRKTSAGRAKGARRPAGGFSASSDAEDALVWVMPKFAKDDEAFRHAARDDATARPSVAI